LILATADTLSNGMHREPRFDFFEQRLLNALEGFVIVVLGLLGDGTAGR